MRRFEHRRSLPLVALTLVLLVAACEPPLLGPCDGVTCSGNGRCDERGGSPLCDCISGYHAEGLSCVRNGSDAGTHDSDNDTDLDDAGLESCRGEGLWDAEFSAEPRDCDAPDVECWGVNAENALWTPDGDGTIRYSCEALGTGGEGSYLTFGETAWSNYRVEATVTVEESDINGQFGCGLIARFRTIDEDHIQAYFLEIADRGGGLKLGIRDQGTLDSWARSFEIGPTNSYHLALEVHDGIIRGFLNGEMLDQEITVESEPLDGAPRTGRAGLMGDMGICAFRDVRVIACDE